ncbi:MAG: hypothetical protein IJG84_12045 [Kiritimatiellae bacterium]|nr:hypothetical protein [Kiritimatiellia bacterium]
MLTTVGQVLVNDALPPRFRDYGRVMDSNGIEQVLQQIAREAPEEYAAVTKRLMDVGNSAAFDTGTTIRMSDLRPAYDKRPILQALDIAEEKIRSDKTLTDAQKSEMIEKLYDKANSRIMEETYNAELARKNQLALQVASKARGNKVQLAAFISTPGTYSDPSGKMVPMFIRHSFAEGLTPAEYWAGSFGARNGVVSTKTATAKGGAFGKLLSASAIAQVITEEDCGTESGLPVKVDDDDNIGAVLAKPAGGYDAGTVITKQVLSDLRKDKRHDEIVVRSPTTCGCKSGICSRCAGIRETGGFPPIGYNLGTNAASAFAERITQGALNCLAEGTLVRMADGSVKPIETIKPGEIVLGSDLNGNISPTKVLNWWDNGIQPCVKTVFEGGIELISTSIHKILCKTTESNGHIDAREVGEKGVMVAVVSPEVDSPLPFGNFEIDALSMKFFQKRVSQNPVGMRHVYDIEVECKTHLYLLKNGLKVHNTKHSGKSMKGKGQYQGFEMITSLAKVPKVFPDRATLSTIDGTVTKIEDAPQGGKYVFVEGNGGEENRHYVAPGYDIDVKVGDEMEAGDQISDGVIDPSELVKYKGIGEARKYWASRFTKAMRDSGMPANRRNAEVLARTIMNTVKLENEDEAGEGLPGDVLTYTAWSTGYKPRKSSTFAPPTVASIGKYLEQPVLHYTIGTRITPSVIKTMKKFKVDRMMVNDTRPEVEPFMERIEDSDAEKKDWMARLGTTYLKSRLQEDVARGAESHLHSTEPYPGIAKGVEFGDWGQPLSKNKSEHFTY